MDLLIAAKKIADSVEAESLKQNVPVAVTVIDIHGNVVLVHRMTGAPAFSLALSERKEFATLCGAANGKVGRSGRPAGNARQATL